MFFSGHGVHFRFEHSERTDDTRAGFMGLDHVVDKASLCGYEGAGEAVVEFGDFFWRRSSRDSPFESSRR